MTGYKKGNWLKTLTQKPWMMRQNVYVIEDNSIYKGINLQKKTNTDDIVPSARTMKRNQNLSASSESPQPNESNEKDTKSIEI